MVVRDTYCQVTPPLNWPKTAGSQRPGNALPRPDAKSTLVNGDIDCAVGLKHGQHPSRVQSLCLVLFTQGKHSDSGPVAHSVVDLGACIHGCINPGGEIREIEDQDSA